MAPERSLLYNIELNKLRVMDIVNRREGEVEGAIISVCAYPKPLG